MNINLENIVSFILSDENSKCGQKLTFMGWIGGNDLGLLKKYKIKVGLNWN